MTQLFGRVKNGQWKEVKYFNRHIVFYSNRVVNSTRGVSLIRRRIKFHVIMAPCGGAVEWSLSEVQPIFGPIFEGTNFIIIHNIMSIYTVAQFRNLIAACMV